jgi:hypothetical protein
MTKRSSKLPVITAGGKFLMTPEQHRRQAKLLAHPRVPRCAAARCYTCAWPTQSRRGQGPLAMTERTLRWQHRRR